MKNLNNIEMTNNFESSEFRKMMNNYRVWDKYFNGMAMYKGREVEAVSDKLNGLSEFGEVVNYKKEGKEVILLVEFCGDEGIWKEWVNVDNCKPFNKF